MESSSEDSFTWTDTSSDSIDSELIPRGTLEKKLKRNKQTGKSDCDKTKLRHGTEELEHILENMVKVEPESDCDIPNKKKKSKHVEVNGGETRLPSQDSPCYDESYLDLKVKQEQMSAPLPPGQLKRKRKLSEITTDYQSELPKCRLEEASLDSYTEIKHSQLDTEISTKKKKKKSKKRRESEYEVEAKSSLYKVCEDTTSKEDIDSHGTIHSNGIEETLITENTSGNESSYEISAIQSDDHNIHTLSFNSSEIVESKHKGHSLYKTAIRNQLKSDNNPEAGTTDSGRARLSDRIMFEDDSEVEASHTHQTSKYTTPVKLTKFIKTLKIDNMKLISEVLSPSSTVTCDDDVWIVHCPKEMDVEGFCDADLNINEKSRVKIGGQTYDATLDGNGCDMAAVLTMAHGKYQINNLPLSGIIKLRKRIPKAHFRNDNIMVNNQTNFVPLPETKCRHPLFGSNYKKALKIPTTIAQKLNSHMVPEDTLNTENRKKKKHKKDKKELKEELTDSKYEVSTIVEPAVSVPDGKQRRKKRKHLEEDDLAAKQIKKFKHDPESAEAWESEKAIEQNLFNF